MNNIHHIHKHKVIDDEEKRLDDASDWIARIDRELTDKEKLNLQSWLSLDKRNTEALLEVAHLWDKMDDLSRLSDLFPQTPPNTNKSNTAWYSAMAASILFVITMGFYQNGFNFSGEQSTVVSMKMNYQTAVGESNTINLPDNSKLVLNTNSFVQIRYTSSARIIDLQRGEIHIDVAHDKSRPLSVIAGGKIIQAVGTAFNVEVQSELVELIVTDGKVLVSGKNNGIKENNIEQIIKRLPQSSMAISKGEKINLDTTGNKIEKVVKFDPVEITASLSWRQGNLIFRGESLAEAMYEISRYTDIEFELTDDKNLQDIQVAGMFKTGDITGLLEVLTNNFNISYQRIGNKKIILNYAG